MLKNYSLKYLLVFGAITLWAIPTAYFQVFSVFQPYDDEGYLMITAKQYLDGYILYDQVYTQYGPVYYFFQWLIHHLINLPITHNVTRLTTLVFWVSMSLLCGIFASRLTKSALAGGAAYALTFFILFRTTSEPGHPQELCGFLLIGALLLLNGKSEGRNFDLRLVLLGIIVALLLLTKINLGIFLGLALAITFVTLSRNNILQRIALTGLTFGAAILPFILFRKYLALGWLRLSISISVGLIGLYLISLIKPGETLITARNYKTATAAFCAAMFAIFLLVFFEGSTPGAFLNGILFQHLKFGDNFFQSAPIQRFSHYWALIALFAAFSIYFLEKRKPNLTRKLAAILKLFFGASVVSMALLDHFNYINVFILLSFATPFLWIALLNQNFLAAPTHKMLPRLALVMAAMLQPLQMFPIAGTQMNYGAFLMAVVGVVCLSDAFAELKVLVPETFAKPRWQAAFAGILILIFIWYMAAFTLTVQKNYQSQIPLSFKGAERIRLPEEDVALYNFLVENIRENCDNFVSIPGVYSLNFWTNIEPPTTFNATANLTLLNNEQQQEIVNKMQTYSRACGVYHEIMMSFGLRNKVPDDFVLSNFVLHSYQLAADWRDFRFFVNSGRLQNLTFYAKYFSESPERIETHLPTRQIGKIAKVQIYDWKRQVVVADSDKSEIGPVDELNQWVNFPILLDGASQKEHKYFLRGPVDSKLLTSGRNSLLLRLINQEGQLLASLPLI